MSIVDLLRKPGILRFGVGGGSTLTAAERPASPQVDDVRDSEKGLI